ncbi:hypothetical protein Tco_1546470 [Tanacetum coccineum]
MCADELHKFSDGMLNDVWTALPDIAEGIRMEYLPMRKWSNLDTKRARVMVQDIDKQIYQRMFLQNLEKFIGGREYGNDLDSKKKKKNYKPKLESFETLLKSLNTLLNSQLSANDKAGFGYNGAKESKVSETITSVSKAETSNSETSNDKVEIPKIKTVRMSEPINKEWESDSEDDEIVVKPKEVTKTVKPSCEKIESINARKETVRQAKNPRKNNKRPKGHKRNWNGMMTHKLAYSSVKRPFNKKTTNYNRYFNKRVNTVKSTRVHSARPNAEVNTVKALASWVWKLKHEDLDHVSKSNSASKTLIRYDYVDALGRKREVSHVFLVWFGHTKEMKESPKVGLGCLMSKRKAESKLGLVDVENDTEGLSQFCGRLDEASGR